MLVLSPVFACRMKTCLFGASIWVVTQYRGELRDTHNLTGFFLGGGGGEGGVGQFLFCLNYFFF